MRTSPNRRTVLRAGSVAGLSLLSGCYWVAADWSPWSSNPDAGRDSYGIHLENKMKKAQTVHLEVAKPFGEKTLFEETVEIGGGKSREWDEVVNKPEEWVVSAELKSGHSAEDLRDDSIYITPGNESAPVVENVRVVVEQRDLAGTKVAAVTVSAGEK